MSTKDILSTWPGMRAENWYTRARRAHARERQRGYTVAAGISALFSWIALVAAVQLPVGNQYCVAAMLALLVVAAACARRAVHWGRQAEVTR